MMGGGWRKGVRVAEGRKGRREEALWRTDEWLQRLRLKEGFLMMKEDLASRQAGERVKPDSDQEA